MATREVMSCLIDQSVVCLGVFVCTDLENQQVQAIFNCTVALKFFKNNQPHGNIWKPIFYFYFLFLLLFLQDAADMSKLIEKAAELTTSAILDVPPVLNGQTFDTITWF